MSHLLQLTGAVIDMVYAVRALPRSGFEADVTDFMMTPGGGFNAPVAARAAGMQTSMGGSLGTGPLSDMVAAALDAKGITLARPRLPDRDQGCCTVMVEPDGERTFLASPVPKVTSRQPPWTRSIWRQSPMSPCPAIL